MLRVNFRPALTLTLTLPHVSTLNPSAGSDSDSDPGLNR